MIIFPTEEILDDFKKAHFNHLCYGMIDFKKNEFFFEEWSKDEEGEISKPKVVYWYDLASISKVLCNSLSYFINPKVFTSDALLCLNHQGGLPSWGLLDKAHWREQILAYPIHSSPTLYSDFSALRVLLELEKKQFNMKKECEKVWDKNLRWWLDINQQAVHDPNAKNLRAFCSHAGLFATPLGFFKTIENFYQLTQGFEQIEKVLTGGYKERFVFGFDRVLNPSELSLSGNGCSELTIGHLGFTGTSLWIDLKSQKAAIVLSDSAIKYWYEKTILNVIRKKIGQFIWKL